MYKVYIFKKNLKYLINEKIYKLLQASQPLYVFRIGTALPDDDYDLGDYLTIEGKKEQLDFVTLELIAFSFSLTFLASILN